MRSLSLPRSAVAAVAIAGFASPAFAGVPRLTPVDENYVQYLEQFSPATAQFCGNATGYASQVGGSFNPTARVLTAIGSQPHVYPPGCPQHAREVVVSRRSASGAQVDYVFKDPDRFTGYGASVAVIADGGTTPGSAAAEEVFAVGDPYCMTSGPSTIHVYDFARRASANDWNGETGCSSSWTAPRTAVQLPRALSTGAPAAGFGSSVEIARMPSATAGQGILLMGAAHGGEHGTPPSALPPTNPRWTHLSFYQVTPSRLGLSTGVAHKQSIDLRKVSGIPTGWTRIGTDFAMERDLLVVSSVLLQEPCQSKAPIRELLVFGNSGGTYKLIQRMSSDSPGFEHLAPSLGVVPPCSSHDVWTSRVSVDIDGDRIHVGMPWQQPVRGCVATFRRATTASTFKPEVIVDAPEGSEWFGQLVAGGRGRYLAFSLLSTHRDPAQDLPCMLDMYTPGMPSGGIRCPGDECDRYVSIEPNCRSRDILLMDLQVASTAPSGPVKCLAVRRSGGIGASGASEGTIWSDMAFAGPVLFAGAGDGHAIICGQQVFTCALPGATNSHVQKGASIMHVEEEGMPGDPAWPFVGSPEYAIPCGD